MGDLDRGAFDRELPEGRDRGSATGLDRAGGEARAGDPQRHAIARLGHRGPDVGQRPLGGDQLDAHGRPVLPDDLPRPRIAERHGPVRLDGAAEECHLVVVADVSLPVADLARQVADRDDRRAARRGDRVRPSRKSRLGLLSKPWQVATKS